MSLTNIRTKQDGTEMDLLNYFYPVGSIYETANSAFDPNSVWGGTWVKVSDRFLYGVSDSSCVGKCGGSSSITLCSCNLPTIKATSETVSDCVYDGCSYATSLAGCFSFYTTSDNYYSSVCLNSYCELVDVVDPTKGMPTGCGPGVTNYYYRWNSTICYCYGGDPGQSIFCTSGLLASYCCFCNKISVSNINFCTYTPVYFPSEKTTISNSAKAFTNIPAYYGVYIWRRTA